MGASWGSGMNIEMFSGHNSYLPNIFPSILCPTLFCNEDLILLLSFGDSGIALGLGGRPGGLLNGIGGGLGGSGRESSSSLVSDS